MPSAPSEMVELLGKAKQMGLGVGADGMLFGVDSADNITIANCLFGTQVPDFLGLADGIAWLNSLLNGEGKFEDGMSHCLDMTLQMIERGYVNTSYMTGVSGNHVPALERLLKGALMMAYGKADTLNMANAQSEEYEFAMLPFLSWMRAGAS